MLHPKVFAARPGSSRNWRWPIAASAMALLAWGARAWATRDPDLVEGLYVGEVFPRVRVILLALTSRSPVSVAETLLLSIVSLGTVWGVAVMVALRAGRCRLRDVTIRGARCLLWLAPLYLAFLLLWGFHYARVPLIERLGLDASPPRQAELERLAERMVAEAMIWRAQAVEDANGVFRLRDGRASLTAGIREIIEGNPDPLLPGPLPVLRMAWLSPILSALGISGIYIPFTGEPHINAQVPEAHLPCVACHEVAHAAGHAGEDEANFMAWWACARSPRADFRYSGALVALEYLLGALAADDPQGAAARVEGLPAPIRRDLRAAWEFWRRHESLLSRAATDVNDAYLRAQGEPGGVHSYGEMVTLLVAWHRPRPD